MVHMHGDPCVVILEQPLFTAANIDGNIRGVANALSEGDRCQTTTP
jgi:hypothetical protein